MSLNSKRLSRANTNARLKTLASIEADLHARVLELTELREQLWEAQVFADLQNATRARRPRQLLASQSPSVCG
jgi:hypothetical protein